MTVSVGQRVLVDATGRGEIAAGTVRRINDGFAWVDLDSGGFRVLPLREVLEDSPPPPSLFGIQLPAGGFDFFGTGTTAADPAEGGGLSFDLIPPDRAVIPIGLAVAVAGVALWLAFT